MLVINSFSVIMRSNISTVDTIFRYTGLTMIALLPRDLVALPCYSCFNKLSAKEVQKSGMRHFKSTACKVVREKPTASLEINT